MAMIGDKVGEEFKLHRGHQILPRFVLFQVLDKLVEEGVHHNMFGDVFVLSENFLEAAENHFG